MPGQMRSAGRQRTIGWHDAARSERKRFDAIVIGTGFARGRHGVPAGGGGVQDLRARARPALRSRRLSHDTRPRSCSRRPARASSSRRRPTSRAGCGAAITASTTSAISTTRLSVQAAGYGGGSLIYANVHLQAAARRVRRGWPDGVQRRRRRVELDQYFDLAAYMLRRHRRFPAAGQDPAAAERRRRSAARTLAHWFRTPLAVNFERDDADDRTPSGASSTPATCAAGAGSAAITRPRTRST